MDDTRTLSWHSNPGDECGTFSWLTKERAFLSRGAFNIGDESPATLYPSEHKNSASPSDPIINYVLPLIDTASSFSLERIMAVASYEEG